MTDSTTTQRPKTRRPRRAIDTKLRRRIETAVERLLAALDADDAAAGSDGEAEPEADPEPSLGATAAVDQRDGWRPAPRRLRAAFAAGDVEPSLGSVNAALEGRSQATWAAGNTDDREDEHDGAEPDTDEEPSLGASNAVNQATAWNVDTFYTGEREPSLGSTIDIDQRRAWRDTPGKLREALDGGDAEPSLGSLDERPNQATWAAGSRDDGEEQHDAEPDDERIAGGSGSP